MFAGAQIVTTKIVQSTNKRDLIDGDNEEKTEKDLRNISGVISRSRTAIVVESTNEKIERKALVQERKHQRLLEQQKLAQRMEHLMEKVLREAPLSQKDEHHLRSQMKTIAEKVNKESNSMQQSDMIKANNQGAFLLWDFPIGLDGSDNFTLINQSSIDRSWIYFILLSIPMFTLSFITIFGNTVVIYALRTDRHLRTVGNLFILSLATADLIVGCFVMPLAGIYAILERWKMGIGLCRVWLSVDYTASTASIFNLLTLSLDRYWSITSPLQYLGKRTRARALVLIGIAWGLSLLWIIPIFGWPHFFKNENITMEANKCEPEYSHSKAFKVTTAILNFYFPLLVLICLNARIYYEIKRRYRSVLLQRHSNKLQESFTNQNTNSLYNRKRKHAGKNGSSPITITLCDSDRQVCSTTINYTENDSLVLPKIPPKSTANESILRVNFKERKNRSTIPIRHLENRNIPLKRAYSFVEKTNCTSDGATWLTNSRTHSHSPYRVNSPLILSNSPPHRLCANENSLTNANDYHSSQPYSHKSKLASNVVYSQHRYETSSSCRHCSVSNTEQISTSIPCTPPLSTTMNIFNLCHCCSTATSAITINSNSYVNNHTNSTVESYVQRRPVSTSSTSSAAPSVVNHKIHQSIVSSRSQTTTSAPSSTLTRSRPSNRSIHTTTKLKQSTVWNQQEKAFRQLFAIVFGFTCCFLPYFILYMVIAFCDTCVSERVITASVWLGYVNSTMNPFLYALSNKHFRRTFNRLIKRKNHRRSVYN